MIVVRQPRRVAHGRDKWGAGPPNQGSGARASCSLAMSHERWAMNHEPLTIDDRSINWQIDYFQSLRSSS